MTRRTAALVLAIVTTALVSGGTILSLPDASREVTTLLSLVLQFAYPLATAVVGLLLMCIVCITT